jgi:hypothetical protein
MEKDCKKCGIKISKPINESSFNWKTRHLYCSKKCKYESMKGKIHSLEHKNKISSKLKGRKQTVEHRKKVAESKRGEKSHFWKGGIAEINNSIRHSVEYKLWREAVFERDNWTCIWCKVRGGKLNADHIKPFALYPELRFAIDNGRTLWEKCHKTTDTYGKHLIINLIL